MKDTLVSRFGTDIRNMSTPDMPKEAYKDGLKTIHTSSVANTIRSMNANKVLNTHPPQYQQV
jgi:hypothetical protein